MAQPFEEGRTAASEALRRALATAPLSYIEGALANPGLDPGHAVLALSNPAIVPLLIQRIGRNPSWIKTYKVKAAIVLHPKTPRAVAMNLVTFLWWRDLVRVTDQAKLSPVLRRSAERLLALRLQELALGEKIALARIASRGLIGALRAQAEPMVIRSLLQNPRLMEEDALAIANGVRTTGPVLRALADDPRFALRPAVRKAIARHPETPASVALHIVQNLSSRDLKELSRSPRVPGLVKVAAQRLLEVRRSPTAENKQ
jgi:hypothetical protein